MTGETCDHCGDPAVLVGHAFVAGGSFPVATCADDERLLVAAFGVESLQLRRVTA